MRGVGSHADMMTFIHDLSNSCTPANGSKEPQLPTAARCAERVPRRTICLVWPDALVQQCDASQARCCNDYKS